MNILIQMRFSGILILSFIFSSAFSQIELSSFSRQRDIAIQMFGPEENSVRNLLSTKIKYERDSLSGNNESFFSGIKNRVFKDYLLKYHGDFGHIEVLPILNFSGGFENNKDDFPFRNTRGVMINGRVAHHFYFSTGFLENQARFPHYLDLFIRKYRVVPGQGRVRNLNGAYDFSSSFGLLSYKPNSNFSATFGNGSNFWGDGFRSLFLSYNAFSYPFLRLNTRLGIFQYTNLFAQFVDYSSELNSYELLGRGYDKKSGSFHYLNIDIRKNFRVGLFEGIIWQRNDSADRALEWNYYNPVIFYRPLEYSLGSPDNALMGMSIKWTLMPLWCTYAQFLIDDININNLHRRGFYQQKQGYQIGTYWKNPMQIKNLLLQAEFNSVRPYTYAHKLPSQNYSHYNQPLAHPLGANFREVLFLANYQIGAIYLEGMYMYAIKGENHGTVNYGGDIFASDYTIPKSYGNTIFQGKKVRIERVTMKCHYLINKKSMLGVFTSIMIRKLKSEVSSHDFFLEFGVKTDLFPDNFEI